MGWLGGDEGYEGNQKHRVGENKNGAPKGGEMFEGGNRTIMINMAHDPILWS